MAKINKISSGYRNRANLLFSVLWVFLLLGVAGSALGNPYSMTYGGRLTTSNGSPVEGPVNIQVQFYSESSGGEGLLIEPISFTSVPLDQGVFQIVIDLQKLSKNDFHRVFSSDAPAWIEVSNMSENTPTIYPRQQFSIVPYALKIPVDEKSLIYTSEGKLKVGQLPILTLESGGSSNTTKIKSASYMDQNVVYTFPPTPSAGAYLRTDSAGNLSWGTPSGGGDMSRSAYDIDESGIVDNAEKFGGELPSFYRDASNINSGSLADARLSSNVMSGVNAANSASSANTPSSIVTRDGSGNFSAGSITGSLVGNVTGNVSGSSSSFTGSLSGDVTGTQGATAIATGAVTLAKIAACADGKILKMSGVNWTCADDSNAGGTVTSIATGTGLIGGPITASGTISLDDSGVVSGTYTKVTVDAKGRATVGASLVEADIPALSTAGKVSGDAINSGTIGGSAAINTSGSISTTASFSSAGVTVSSSGGATQKILFNDADNSNYVGLKAADTVAENKIWTLPSADGTNGQFLKTDGSGNLSWTDQAASAVTSVNTLTGAVTLTTTNIAEGTSLYYTDARAKTAAVGDAITDAVTDKAPSQNAVFDALALKSEASHNHSGVYEPAGLSTDVVTTTKILNGAVTSAKIANLGVDTANINTGAVTPAKIQSCADTQILKMVGTNWTCSSDASSGGTVTSVATGTGLTGGTITGSGTISVAAGGIGTTQLADDAVTTAKITDANVTSAKIASGVDATKIGSGAVDNTELGYLDGVTSSIQTQIDGKATSSHTQAATTIGGGAVDNTEFGYLDGVTSAIQTQFSGKQASITAASDIVAGSLTSAKQNAINVGPYSTAGGNTGELRFKELAANGANYIGFKAPDLLAADKIWTLPSADGTNGQFLKTDGSGNLSWIDQAASAVTSVNTLTGAVTLTTTNIAEGTSLYYTDARAKTAAVGDAITDAVTDKAPSQNAVFDALALKSATSHNHSGVYEPAGLSTDVVTTTKILNAAVTSAKIASLGVDTANINTGAVTPAKIQGCADTQILKMVGTNWTCSSDANSGGTVTSVATGTGLTGGTITGSGTISVASGGIGSTQLADSSVTTSKIDNGAVTTAKLATCSDGKVLKMVGGAWTCVYEAITKSTTVKKCNGSVCINASTSLNH